MVFFLGFSRILRGVCLFSRLFLFLFLFLVFVVVALATLGVMLFVVFSFVCLFWPLCCVVFSMVLLGFDCAISVD
jgi:hypothetical protein